MDHIAPDGEQGIEKPEQAMFRLAEEIVLYMDMRLSEIEAKLDLLADQK